MYIVGARGFERATRLFHLRAFDGRYPRGVQHNGALAHQLEVVEFTLVTEIDYFVEAQLAQLI